MHEKRRMPATFYRSSILLMILHFVFQNVSGINRNFRDCLVKSRVSVPEPEVPYLALRSTSSEEIINSLAVFLCKEEKFSVSQMKIKSDYVVALVNGDFSPQNLYLLFLGIRGIILLGL